jgi:hypothetical protein
MILLISLFALPASLSQRVVASQSLFSTQAAPAKHFQIILTV